MSQECEDIPSEPLDIDESSEISQIVEVDGDVSSPKGEMMVDSEDIF